MKNQLSLTLTFAHLIISYILKTYGFSMDMIPIDSPKLQLVPQNFTEQEKHQLLTSISLSRAYKHRSSNTKLNPNSFLEPLFKHGYYVTSIGIGWVHGKPYNAYMLLDTGSPTTWIQCEGCEVCFTFEGEKFDYRVSETYQRIGLDDRSCRPREDYRGSCGFTVQYGLEQQGPEAKGMLGRDTFFFGNYHEPKSEAYPGIAFGCGFENKGFDSGRGFVRSNNIISGVLGLSPLRTQRAIMIQLDGYIKGRFSYCLLPYFRTGYNKMYFGDDAQIKGDETRKLQSIPMFVRDHYFLWMTGISVDGERLLIDPLIFYPIPSKRSGIIIDTGSPITWLVKQAFDPLYDAIVKYFFRRFGLRPRLRQPNYSACYDVYPPNQDDYPTVIFHFKGQSGQQGEVNMVFSFNNMFKTFPLEDHSEIMCLQVMDTPIGPSLLGAFQQTDFAILYDIPNSLLQFVPQICVPTEG